MNQYIFILLLCSIGSHLTTSERICYDTTSDNYNVVVRFNRLYGTLLTIGDINIWIDDDNLRILEERFTVYLICCCKTRPCLYEELSFNVNLTRIDIAFTCNAGFTQRVAHMKLYETPQRRICHPESDDNTEHDDFSAVVISFSIDGEVKYQTNWKSMCNDTTCNGGRCFSPYKQEIICDCSNTIGNGRHCDKQCTVKEVGTLNYSMRPEVLKISLRHLVPILTIYGPIHSISLGVDTNDVLRLKFARRVSNRHCKIEKYVITERFNWLSNSTMLLTFGENKVSIEYFNGSVWERGAITEVQLPALPQFHQLSIGKSGHICVAWKTSTDHRLRDVDLATSTSDESPGPLESSSKSSIKGLDNGITHNNQRNSVDQESPTTPPESSVSYFNAYHVIVTIITLLVLTIIISLAIGFAFDLEDIRR